MKIHTFKFQLPSQNVKSCCSFTENIFRDASVKVTVWHLLLLTVFITQDSCWGTAFVNNQWQSQAGCQHKCTEGEHQRAVFDWQSTFTMCSIIVNVDKEKRNVSMKILHVKSHLKLYQSRIAKLHKRNLDFCHECI